MNRFLCCMHFVRKLSLRNNLCTWPFLETHDAQARNSVKLNKGHSESYLLERRIRQDDPCSGSLFDIYLDDLVEAVSKVRVTRIVVKVKQVFVFLFADEISVIAEAEEKLQESLILVKAFSAFSFSVLSNKAAA